MNVPSCHSLIAMFLMLMLGVGLGMLMMTGHHTAVPAVIETPQAAATAVLDPAVSPTPEPAAPEAPPPPAPAPYLGVLFARQLVDIAARSDGRLEAIYVQLGDHLQPGAAVAKLESYALTQQRDMAEATLESIKKLGIRLPGPHPRAAEPGTNVGISPQVPDSVF